MFKLVDLNLAGLRFMGPSHGALACHGTKTRGLVGLFFFQKKKINWFIGELGPFDYVKHFLSIKTWGTIDAPRGTSQPEQYSVCN